MIGKRAAASKAVIYGRNDQSVGVQFVTPQHARPNHV